MYKKLFLLRNNIYFLYEFFSFFVSILHNVYSKCLVRIILFIRSNQIRDKRTKKFKYLIVLNHFTKYPFVGIFFLSLMHRFDYY